METDIKVLSYNVFLRPSGIMSNFSLNGDYKKDRLNTIANIITNYDIVLLQEIFDFNLLSTKKDKIINLVENAGLKYNAYSKNVSFKPVDSGLLILSKFPIIEIDSVIYDSCFCIDMLSAKGILYAKVLLPNNDFLHIILRGAGKYYINLKPVLSVKDTKANNPPYDKQHGGYVRGDEKNDNDSVLCLLQTKEIVLPRHVANDNKMIKFLEDNYKYSDKSGEFEK